MDTVPPLTRLQQRLLGLCRSYGSFAVIGVITGGSMVGSVALIGITMVLSPPPNTEMVIWSLVMAAIVPAIVAPLASSSVTRLLLAVADARDELHVLATTDSLTGLANRRAFFGAASELRQSPPAGTQLIAGMVDIDHFKTVNDTHGHAMGDSALVSLASRLDDVAHDIGIVGRLGGDEFGLFLAVPDAQVEAVSTALRSACSSFRTATGLRVEASLGLYTVVAEDSIDDAVRHADWALYQNKSDRREVGPSATRSGTAGLGPAGLGATATRTAVAAVGDPARS